MSKLKFLDRFKPGIFPSEMIHPMIDKALSNEDHFVRSEAARSPNTSKEHLDKVLSDSDEYVAILAASNNPIYKKYYPNGHK